MPDRRLDGDIFVAVGLAPKEGTGPYDWKRGRKGSAVYGDEGCWYRATGDGAAMDETRRAPAYTGSVDAARTLVPKQHAWAGGNVGEEDSPWACVTDPEGVDYACRSAASEEIALTIACLRAI